jgi:hypothetical protein
MSVTGKAVYSFTEDEIKSLALIYRNHPELFSSLLDSFGDFLENYLYQIMTIEEAERFFNE